jgi:hypothetical protein
MVMEQGGHGSTRSSQPSGMYASRSRRAALRTRTSGEHDRDSVGAVGVCDFKSGGMRFTHEQQVPEGD